MPWHGAWLDDEFMRPGGLVDPVAMVSDQLFQLVYVSRCSVPMSDEALHAIQMDAAQRNREAGVTGVLLYGHGSFLQLLEGTKAKLKQIFGRIALDERHQHCSVLYFKPTHERSAGSWSMGVLHLDSSRSPIPLDQMLRYFSEHAEDPTFPDPVASLIYHFEKLTSETETEAA